jgi:galactitol PTS system EIIA component
MWGLGMQKDDIQTWLHRDLVMQNIEFDNWMDVLKIISNKLYEKGFVNKEFYEALIEREIKFPTGLPIDGAIKVAIPHVYPEFVEKSGIGIGILAKPVLFGEMGSSTRKIPCSIVFVLALKDANNHLKLLQRLMDFITCKKNIEKMMIAKDKDSIIGLMVNELSEGGANQTCNRKLKEVIK